MANINIKKECMELEEILKEKTNGKFQPDFLSGFDGQVHGNYGEEVRLLITFYPGSYMILSTNSNGKNAIDELLPILKEVMGDKEPICRYDLKNKEKSVEEVMPTIEWDIEDPEKRLRDLANGRAHDDSEVLNLQVLNGKEAADYIDTPEEKAAYDAELAEKMKNARIYGIDPGCIANSEEVAAYDAPRLNILINELGGIIWSTRHAMAHGWAPADTDLTEEEYGIEFLVNQTRKFGVELPEPAYGKHITPTPSYREWFSFYHDHFEALSEEDYKAMCDAMIANQDYSQYLPEGTWNGLEEEKPTERTMKPGNNKEEEK